MAKPLAYTFDERLGWSEGTAESASELTRVLLSRIPQCERVDRASEVDDRAGTDFWAYRVGGLRRLSIDLKARQVDWKNNPPKGRLPADDVALETWSVKERGKVGWTRDATKMTDYVLWYWTDSGRFLLVPFPPLCFVFSRLWEEWSHRFRNNVHTQRTHVEGGGGWHSECVMVPRWCLLEALERWGNGYVSRPGGRGVVQRTLFPDWTKEGGGHHG